MLIRLSSGKGYVKFYEFSTQSRDTAKILLVKHLIRKNKFYHLSDDDDIFEFINEYANCNVAVEWFHYQYGDRGFTLNEFIDISENIKSKIRKALNIYYDVTLGRPINYLTDHDYKCLASILPITFEKEIKIKKFDNTNITECLI